MKYPKQYALGYIICKMQLYYSRLSAMITTLLVACLPALATSITLPASNNDASYSCWVDSPATEDRRASMKDCERAAANLPSLIEPFRFVQGGLSDRRPNALPVSVTYNTCRVRVDLLIPQSLERSSWTAINVATLQILAACSSIPDPRSGNEQLVGGQKVLGLSEFLRVTVDRLPRETMASATTGNGTAASTS